MNRTLTKAIRKLQDAGYASTDLIKKEYRDADRTDYPLNGLCYVLCEALYHLSPDTLKPFRIDWKAGGTHWFLRDTEHVIIDMVSHGEKPLCTPKEYNAGRRANFLPQSPSLRARTLLDRAGLSLPLYPTK